MFRTYNHPGDDAMWGAGYGVISSDTYLPGHALMTYGTTSSRFPGFASSQWRLSDIGVTVVMLSNEEFTDIETIDDTVAGIILAQE
jgi:hypothetical protein